MMMTMMMTITTTIMIVVDVIAGNMNFFFATRHYIESTCVAYSSKLYKSVRAMY